MPSEREPRFAAVAAPQGDDPASIADALARLDPEQRAARFRLLPKDSAARVFDILEPAQQRELLQGLRSAHVRQLLEDMDPDDRARVLDETPAVVARQLLAQLSPPERDLTMLLLGYPPESAGRIMSPELVELRPELTVAEALDRVRSMASDAETIYVLPVRDAERHLEGVVELGDLILAAPDAKVATLVDRDYPVVSAYSDQEPVARLMQQDNLLAVPVVDGERRLVGLVTFDDAMDVLQAEEEEDLSRAGASEPLPYPYFAVPVTQLVRSRIVWLFFLVAAATLTVTVLGVFESTLEQIVTLALFIPLLIGTGGNCGAQAATTMTRAIALGEVRISDLAPSLFKEARVGIALGVVFAVIGFPLITLIFDVELAATVSLTLIAICTWATMIGALLPLIASRIGIDPAVVSAPVVTTLVDATGLLIYFGIAQLVML